MRPGYVAMRMGKAAWLKEWAGLCSSLAGECGRTTQLEDAAEFWWRYGRALNCRAGQRNAGGHGRKSWGRIKLGNFRKCKQPD
ncbi:hypothetical protein Pyn_34432 [Prunus yedoensis var. nudiflora]|uniref:Uncharacterized protein n=1 Tax=Prunus yedoensis var. nudiflora TaxID=2094558 RepID=A0A314ZMG3_PRUYE|nr:hypothetical protein Pyn_34432 [Prunus yedoensis var. nudiflora]